MYFHIRIFKTVISLFFTMYLLGMKTTLNASETSHCLVSITDNYDTFCEQAARNASLAIDWGVLNRNSRAKERLIDKKVVNKIIIAEISPENNTGSSGDTSDDNDERKLHKWPRPKTLNRSFEATVTLLDLDGKKDLRSCALYGMENLSDFSKSLPSHQLNAMLHFSNTHLGATGAVELNSKSDLNSKSCKQLLNLVLGRA